MPFFSTNKIASEEEAVAAELSKARTRKKISLDRAAADLKIRPVYLKALEAGDFRKLPPGVYAKNYLKEYAEYLGLDGKELAEACVEQSPGLKKGPAGAFFDRRAIKTKTWEISLALKAAGLGLIALLCFAYLGYYLYGVISPPFLIVASPPEDFLTADSFVVITGLTEEGANVFINGEAVFTNDAGEFIKEVSLKSGINVIDISARKKYGREKVLQRQILMRK